MRHGRLRSLIELNPRLVVSFVVGSVLGIVVVVVKLTSMLVVVTFGTGGGGGDVLIPLIVTIVLLVDIIKVVNGLLVNVCIVLVVVTILTMLVVDVQREDTILIIESKESNGVTTAPRDVINLILTDGSVTIVQRACLPTRVKEDVTTVLLVNTMAKLVTSIVHLVL
jgi:hypothetical protein